MHLLLLLAGAGAMGICFSLLFVAGFVARAKGLSPAEFLERVESKLGGPFAEAPPEHEESKSKAFPTIFFPLEGKVGSVPVTREGAGGGVTSFGDAILLLTHEGKIFSARSADSIVETTIEVPDNGLSDFMAASKFERYRGYWFIFPYYRYNAILHYSTPEQHGIAISYTEYRADKECYNTAIAVLTLDPKIQTVDTISARKEDWDVIYRTRPCLPLKRNYRALEGHMAGGRLAFKAPATLYLGSGDYHWDGINAPKALAQDPDNDYGKVVAIDLGSLAAHSISLGNRNMQGIAVDGKGRLWVLEHGVRGGDELNRIVEGANYGWPKVTLGTLYNRLPLPNTLSYGRHDGFTNPTYAWLPSVGVSNLSTINRFHPAWDGDMLAATMIDESLYRIRITDNRVLFAERISVGHRIRDLHFLKDRLVLWTDDKKLIFVSVAQPTYTNQVLAEYLAKRPYDENHRSQVEAAVNQCLECHSLNPGEQGKAPNLARAFNARIGSTDFDRYSEALRARSDRWSRANLTTFLKNPQAFAPGTAMPDPGITDPFVLGEVIDLLEAIGITEPDALARLRGEGPYKKQ
jgi:cytochrome c2